MTKDGVQVLAENEVNPAHKVAGLEPLGRDMTLLAGLVGWHMYGLANHLGLSWDVVSIKDGGH